MINKKLKILVFSGGAGRGIIDEGLRVDFKSFGNVLFLKLYGGFKSLASVLDREANGLRLSFVELGLSIFK